MSEESFFYLTACLIVRVKAEKNLPPCSLIKMWSFLFRLVLEGGAVRKSVETKEVAKPDKKVVDTNKASNPGPTAKPDPIELARNAWRNSSSMRTNSPVPLRCSASQWNARG